MSEDKTNPNQSRKQSTTPKPESTKLIKMELDGKTADVHPNEVANMDKFGWRRVH